MKYGIYTASKTHHYRNWQYMRQFGYPIISTWIDEGEPGSTEDFNDLWERCFAEAASCKYFLLYREPEDVLKGAWAELGAAIASECPYIFAVGLDGFTLAKYDRIRKFPNLFEAVKAINTTMFMDGDKFVGEPEFKGLAHGN